MNREKEFKRKLLGKEGENIACELMRSRGCRVLFRNIREGHRELDIICLDGDGLHFVEVKSRQEPVEGEAWEAVNASKRRNLCSAALSFLSSEAYRSLSIRTDEYHFDILTVVWDETGESYRTEYIPDAFYPMFT